MNIHPLFDLGDPVYAPVREGETPRAVVRDAYMRQAHVHAPDGLTCGSCAFFVRGEKVPKKRIELEDGSWFMEPGAVKPTGACSMYTGGPSTAWKPNAQACALWELEGE